MAPIPLPDLGARQLQAVLAVAEHGSFVAAAAQLGTSQPALTRLIQRVEDVLGVTLFERTTRRVRPTPAGREFLALAERMLNDLRLTARSMRELAEAQRGQVIIACIMSVAQGALPGLVARYLADRQALELHLREGVHGTVLEDVRSGVADFGITYLEALPDTVAATPLGREVFLLVLPRGHRLAARQAVPLAALAEEKLVALPIESRTRRIIDGAAAAAGLVLRHSATATQFATMLALVRAGLGLAIVPAGAVARLAGSGLVARPLVEPALSRELGLIQLREREVAPAAAGFIALLRRHWPAPLMQNSE